MGRSASEASIALPVYRSFEGDDVTFLPLEWGGSQIAPTALPNVRRRAEVRLVSVLPHDFVRGLHGFGQHVKKGAGAHRTKDHAAAVFIGLHAVIHLGRRENLFQ